MNGFELQTCMAMVSIYLSLNILTMIPWIWIRLYVTIQVLKRCLQMNLCFAFFLVHYFFMQIGIGRKISHIYQAL